MHFVLASHNCGPMVLHFKCSYLLLYVKRPCVTYTFEQVFMFDSYMRNGCIRKAKRRFWTKFQDVTVPNMISIINTIISKLNQIVSLQDKMTQFKVLSAH
jgi:hypothetical protein